jgi:hypothetical protein
MQALDLSGGGVTGQLPSSWGNWPSLATLNLSFNKITGTLPASFAGLSSLQSLRLEYNKLQGTLPAAWGDATVMPQKVSILLAGNKGIGGTVPMCIPTCSCRHALLSAQEQAPSWL